MKWPLWKAIYKQEQKYRSLACLYHRKPFPVRVSASAHQKHFLLTIPLIWQLPAIIKTWQMVSQRLFQGPTSTAAHDTAAGRDRLSFKTPFRAQNRRVGCLWLQKNDTASLMTINSYGKVQRMLLTNHRSETWRDVITTHHKGNWDIICVNYQVKGFLWPDKKWRMSSTSLQSLQMLSLMEPVMNLMLWILCFWKNRNMAEDTINLRKSL